MTSKIEDYALIGDCETAALVARDGSIDWLCWPRFDSGACLAALLGTPENGRWQIAPAVEPSTVARSYIEDTLVLEHVLDAFDPNVSLGASADGDVLLTFASSGATVELNGIQANGYNSLDQLGADINIAYQP